MAGPEGQNACVPGSGNESGASTTKVLRPTERKDATRTIGLGRGFSGLENKLEVVNYYTS